MNEAPLQHHGPAKILICGVGLAESVLQGLVSQSRLYEFGLSLDVYSDRDGVNLKVSYALLSTLDDKLLGFCTRHVENILAWHDLLSLGRLSLGPLNIQKWVAANDEKLFEVRRWAMDEYEIRKRHTNEIETLRQEND
ncbi:hypothetical protein CR513_09568, partial [Mucuna pruriens]